MLKTRVIPILLLKNGGLSKGERFKKHKYVGDPINAVKIFNEKEVDELALLDTSVTNLQGEPNYELIEDIATEAFMPIAYGGGVKNTTQIERLFRCGIEKVIINSEFFYNPNLVSDASRIAGSQSIVVSMDVKKSIFGKYEVFVNNGEHKTGFDPVTYAKMAEKKGAGEIIVTSIDREGTGKGFDLDLLEMIVNSVDVPVVGQGGAGNLNDFKLAVDQAGVSAVAAGNFFTFHGKYKAVLITYPNYSVLENLFKE